MLRGFRRAVGQAEPIPPAERASGGRQAATRKAKTTAATAPAVTPLKAPVMDRTTVAGAPANAGRA